MKTLILVRHAKSDHKNDPSVSDFDRPLNRRGERDAPVMAARLADSGVKVDALVSSPAVRALSTAEAFAQALGLPIQTDARIYEAGIPQLLETVRSLDDRHGAVMLFGHNPGFSDFLRYLTDERYADLPTSGVAVIDLPLKSWRHTFEGKGLLKSSLESKTDTSGVPPNTPQLSWVDRLRFWRFQRAQRFEIIAVLVIAVLLLLILVPFLMHQSIDRAGVPQQGSLTP